jgi:enoyl-CoA hydratase/carnithine racemase
LPACGKPVIIALDGAICTAEMSLALSCRASVLASRATIVLPDTIAAGRKQATDAATALEMGIIDVIVEGKLRAAAVDFARISARMTPCQMEERRSV